jgi:hypothetical protein
MYGTENLDQLQVDQVGDSEAPNRCLFCLPLGTAKLDILPLELYGSNALFATF